MTIRFTQAIANNRAQQVAAALTDDPEIWIYAGTKPATPEGAPAGALLLRFPLGSTPVTVTDRVITFNLASPTVQVLVAGQVSWGRLINDPSGTPTPIMDGDAGIVGGGHDFQFTQTEFQPGAFATMTVAQITEP